MLSPRSSQAHTLTVLGGRVKWFVRELPYKAILRCRTRAMLYVRALPLNFASGQTETRKLYWSSMWVPHMCRVKVLWKSGTSQSFTLELGKSQNSGGGEPKDYCKTNIFEKNSCMGKMPKRKFQLTSTGQQKFLQSRWSGNSSVQEKTPNPSPHQILMLCPFSQNN